MSSWVSRMSSRQRFTAGLTSILLTMLSLLYYPTNARAAELAERIKCAPELPNKLWTQNMAKSYAKFVMGQYGWDNRAEYRALVKLWNRESHWNPLAYNSEAVQDGSHAGGIPQILGMTTRTPAPLQIDRGLAYIKHRYGKPSIAWAHHRVHNYY